MTKTEKQKMCQYCHEPFLDLSEKVDYEVYLGDATYCGIDGKIVLEYGGSDETVKINYCPMCGRKL